MMDKKKKWFQSSAVIAVAFIAAIGLLAFAGIGSARAALNIKSGEYKAQVTMDDIGITLMENGTGVAVRDYNSKKADGTWVGSVTGDLLTNTFVNSEKEAESVMLDKEYNEKIAVKNSGSINEYVRVTVRRYWKYGENDEENGGKKIEDTKFPKYIELSLGGKSIDAVSSLGSWVKDEGATTAERLVFYYTTPLAPGGTTDLLTDTIKISSDIAKEVSVDTQGNTTVYTYKYDGAEFFLEVTADAVQENNIEDAIGSAWGTNPAGISG